MKHGEERVSPLVYTLSSCIKTLKLRKIGEDKSKEFHSWGGVGASVYSKNGAPVPKIFIF